MIVRRDRPLVVYITKGWTRKFRVLKQKRAWVQRRQKS